LIIWQGLGFLAALIPVLIAVLFEIIVDAKFGKGYTDQHHWIWGVSMFVSAAVLWFLGTKLADPGRQLIDPQTGQVVMLRKKHTLLPNHLDRVPDLRDGLIVDRAIFAAAKIPLLQPSPQHPRGLGQEEVTGLSTFSSFRTPCIRSTTALKSRFRVSSLTPALVT